MARALRSSTDRPTRAMTQRFDEGCPHRAVAREVSLKGFAPSFQTTHPARTAPGPDRFLRRRLEEKGRGDWTRKPFVPPAPVFVVLNPSIKTG